MPVLTSPGGHCRCIESRHRLHAGCLGNSDPTPKGNNGLAPVALRWLMTRDTLLLVLSLIWVAMTVAGLVYVLLHE